MDFSGSQTFASATPQQVYSAITNPAVLKACVPGAEDVTVQGDTANISIRITMLMINDVFVIPAKIISQNPPSQLVIGIDRAGSYGSLKGQATIDLAPAGAGTTLTYTAHFDLGGKIGMADNAIGQQAAKSGLNTFFKNLEAQVK